MYFLLFSDFNKEMYCHLMLQFMSDSCYAGNIETVKARVVKLNFVKFLNFIYSPTIIYYHLKPVFRVIAHFS